MAADWQNLLFPQFTLFYIAYLCDNVSMKQPFTEKTCPVCGITKPRSEYYKKKDTVSHKCKPCSLADSKARAPRYASKYRAYQNDWRKTRYNESLEFRDKISAQKKAAYKLRKVKVNEARRLRWLTDPDNPAKLYYRRKDVKDRTPKWVDKKELLRIYAGCPPGMEVDHIIPLKGLIDHRPVCGLHVPWNLQYLTTEENRRKHCRVSEKDIIPLHIKR